MPLERQIPNIRQVHITVLHSLFEDSIGPECYPHFISKEIKASLLGGSGPSPASALSSCAILSKSLGLDFLIYNMVDEAMITNDPLLSCPLTVQVL